MYSGMLEKYLHAFCTHIKGMYFLSKKKMSTLITLYLMIAWHWLKGQAGPLSTNIVLLRLLLRLWNSEHRYDCQKWCGKCLAAIK